MVSLLKELLREPLLECFVNITLLLLVIEGVVPLLREFIRAFLALDAIVLLALNLEDWGLIGGFILVVFLIEVVRG